MVYICPTCGKEFDIESKIQKHFLQCWKEQHPYHKSKDAPRGKDVTTREVNDDVINFFNSFSEVK